MSFIYSEHDVVAAWRSSNTVGRINEVTVRQAWLVLGWVTASSADKPPQYFTKPPEPAQLHTLSVLFKVKPSLHQAFLQSSMLQIFVSYTHCCITPKIL